MHEVLALSLEDFSYEVHAYLIHESETAMNLSRYRGNPGPLTPVYTVG